ncbi:hypothetical protein MMC12_003915, partial [Toensbergia leucococca]|nr:hypothetical protein [Toensbergia leucococca]
MNSSTYRRPGAFSPRPPTSPAQSQGQRQSTDSSASDSSSSSQITSQSVAKQSPQSPVSRRHIFGAPSSNTSSTSLHNFSRPSITHASSELPLRRTSPLISGSESQKHKRQHSQGFFEPSLPTATIADHSAMANLTASQIAAQAAMQHQSSSQHIRKRSLTVPGPQSPPEPASGRLKPAPLQTGTGAAMKPSNSSVSGQQYHNGLVGGHTVAATSAANAAFPRVAQVSPGLTSFDQAPEKEHKLKTERSKMKLFSKPKHIGISSYKDLDRKDKPLPSPNKMGPPGPSGLSKMINPSVTSLVDSTASNTPSLYASNNGSTSTLVPLDRQTTFEKEKAHRHHFLSRQKNKLKDRIDDHTLPLSSASSNSKPLDPSAPQSLYSFAPSSPGPSTTSFTKSMSGLDLRHGGRALREKKKEEKAYAAGPPFESKRSEIDRNDWAVPTSFPSSHAFLGSSIANSASIFGGPPSSHGGDPSQLGLQGFGLSNM